jgi:hypothetical protein
MSPSDDFMKGIGNVADFSVLTPAPPERAPAPDFPEPCWPELDFIPPFEIPGLDRPCYGANSEVMTQALRVVSRSNIGVWFLLNREGKQWRRARWTQDLTGLVYTLQTLQETKNGRIKTHTERIAEADDIGI